MRASDFLDAPEEPAVRTRATDFLDAPSGRSASAFLDAPDSLARAADALDAKVDEIEQQGARQWAALTPADRPTPDELAAASRPARMTLTRGGQPVVQPDGTPPPPMPPAIAPSAEWGEVVKSLPAQFVAGTRSAAANLRRMAAEESVAQHEAVLRRMEAGQGMDQRPEGERPARMTLTRGGQAMLETNAPTPAERQTALLATERAELSKAIAEAAQARADVRLVTPRDQTVAQQALSSLAQSAGPTLLGLAAGILTRNVPLAMAIAGGGGAAQQAGATYGEARDEHGATHRQASLAAAIDAMLEGGGEMLPLGFALKPGTPIFTRVFGTIAREAGQEAATQLAQDLRAMAMENPKLTLGEAWHNVKVAALAGAGGGAIYGGAGAAVNASRSRVAAAAASDDPEGGAPAATPASEPAAASQAQSAELGMTPLAPPAAQPAPPAGAHRGDLSAMEFLDQVDEHAPDPASQSLDEDEMPQPLEAEADRRSREGLDRGASKGRPLAVIVVEVKAREAETGKVVFLKKRADKALAEVDEDIQKAKTLLQYLPMSSLKKSLKRLGFEQHEAAILRGMAKEYVEDGESPQVAAISAIEDYLLDLEQTREHIIRQIEAKGGIVPKGERAGGQDTSAQARREGEDEGRERQPLHGVPGRGEAGEEGRRPVVGGALLDQGFGKGKHAREAGFASADDMAARDPAAFDHPREVAGEQVFPGGSSESRVAAEQAASAAVPMMPGTNYVGFIDDAAQPASAATTSGKPIRREDVLAPFLKALGVPVYEGRVGKKQLGYYRPRLETVRIKRASDLETAAHELAHLIDDRVFNGFGSQEGVAKTRPWIVGPNARTFANELRSVSYDQRKVHEGWAEFVRLWMTQPERAKAAAPEFTKWFDNFVKQHEYGPAILMAQERMRAWFDQDALARARSKIGEKRDINEHLDSFWDRFRQATVDDLHGIYRMERELVGEVVPRAAYETARLARAVHSIVDGTLRFGHIVRNPDGSYTFKGKGLEQILEPVSDRLDEFLMYAVGRSARELRVQGREHLFTLGEIRAMLALERPEFDRAFKEYQQWNKAILDFAEAHGVINPEARRHWRRAEYLPFHRVGTGEPQRRVGGAEGNWSGIKKLTGGTENIRDVLGNIIGNAAMLIDVALKNEARQRIAELGLLRGGGRFLERIPPESRKVKIDRDQIREKLIEAANAAGQADVERTIDEILAGAPYLMDFLVRGQTPTGGRIMAVLRDGKPTYYEVIDPILYRAVAALNRPAQSQIVRWLSIPRRIGQASITLTPDFALANIARDTVMGAIMSRSGFLPAIDSIRGLTARLRSDPAYAEYIANGGGYASYFVDEAAFRNHLARFYSSKGINPRTVIDAPGKLLYFLETLFDSFELSTRLGEYKRLRAQGEHPRHAAYLAREVSTDFAMRGDSRTLGFFYDTVMFLRPAVVSMDRLFRGVAHDPNRGAIAAKAAMLALLSAALYVLNRDNDDYRDLEDWDRDNYWHFFIPKPDGGHIHFRYPKIWEVGALATLAERAVERIMDGEPKEYAKDFARVIKQVFNLNFIPQALAPLAEQATNKDEFTGRPIEPRGLKDLQPFLRATPGTSETMRQLGQATKALPEALQVNPVRAEALLTGYLNTWAIYGLMLSDTALFSDKLPERRLDQYPVLRRFFRQDPPLHTKHERTFYELLDESRRLLATMRELDRRGEEREIGEREADVLGRATYLNRVQRDLAENRREAERVRRADLSPAEKRAELDRLTAERNALFKATVREIEAEKAAERARSAQKPGPAPTPAGGAQRGQDAASARLRAIRGGISDEARPTRGSV